MGGGFDNPVNDAKIWISGYGQAQNYARRLGYRSADDMVNNFNAGFSDSMSKGGSSSPVGASAELQATVKRNSDLLEMLLEAIENWDNTPLIGDDEIVKQGDRRRELVRKGVMEDV